MGSICNFITREWFNTIALFLLILEYSGSEFLLGIFSVRMILFAIPTNKWLTSRSIEPKVTDVVVQYRTNIPSANIPHG